MPDSTSYTGCSRNPSASIISVLPLLHMDAARLDGARFSPANAHPSCVSRAMSAGGLMTAGPLLQREACPRLIIEENDCLSADP